jgi:hypothetical protein|nr:hypothetical protein [Kofleriaceae bacterium]
MTNRTFVLISLVASGLPALPACFLDNGGSGERVKACAAPIEIDTGASIDHEAGVDAGYYLSYAAGGAWHLDWTCDTKLSALGCEFAGTITSPSLSGATCFQCESNDDFSAQPGEVDWDTITSTGLDGVDFMTSPGETVHMTLNINGLAQPDLVFVPSGGQTSEPDCAPMDVAPSAP